nr:reverse transcriptase domain-containing protein [Tanacetum cinerariifolium]
MSSDNAQSAVTYTSISSDSDGPSWGIPLMNVGELPEMDPYEEVAQQKQAHPLSPAYVPDPMELDEHVPVYVPDPEHPEYHAPSDDDIQVEDDNEDPEKDPEEDPSEENEPEDDDEDPEEDPNEEHESKGFEETESFEEDEILSHHHHLDTVERGYLPAYDQAQLGRRAAMIHRKDDILEEDMPPRRRFALTGSPPGPGHDTRTIARATDRAEDASYVRALQAFERRMEINLRVSYQAQVRIQESENFYTQLLDAQTDRKDIRLEIDVVRGQRTAYETELQEVHQAYLSFEARNRELLARIETLKTHMSRMEWQRQRVEDLAVTQMMRIHTLEARARADTVEDADSNCHDAAYAMTWGTLKKKFMDKYCPKGKIKKLEIKLWNLRVKGNDVAAYTQCFQELALMCTKFL